MNNWQSDSSNSDGSYHSPEDKLGHLLEKRGRGVARKDPDDRDPDYIPEQ
jgi:hypothetical protein